MAEPQPDRPQPDPFDTFYQQLDAERMLREHCPRLVQDAVEILSKHPQAKVAGLILQPGCREGAEMRRILTARTGQELPDALMVGCCPREWIEHSLLAKVDVGMWREEAWQTQQVLAVAAVTRDGVQFAFTRLPEIPEQTG